MEEKNNSLAKKNIAGIGVRYTIFGIMILIVQLIVVALIRRFAPALLEKHYAMTSFILTIVTIYMIGFPLVCLMTKKFETEKLEKSKLGVWKFIQGIFICAGICLVGSFIGAILNALCTIPFGVNTNETVGVAKIMMESNFFMRVLTVGILAPIFEELLFRKVLVDRLAKYSKTFAILASGIMFGLFHGNFSQCFFASGIGIFFAYIYVKTGNIKYTIAYHMIINCTTSIITMAVANRYLNVASEENMQAISAGNDAAVVTLMVATVLLFVWFGFLLLCGLAGLILLIVHFVKKDFKVVEKEDALTKLEAVKMLFINPGMLAFYALIVFKFLQNYLPPILGWK